MRVLYVIYVFVSFLWFEKSSSKMYREKSGLEDEQQKENEYIDDRECLWRQRDKGTNNCYMVIWT